MKRGLGGLCAKSASPGIPVAGQDAWPKARTECVVGCFSKSASCGIPIAGAKGTVVPSPSGQQGIRCRAFQCRGGAVPRPSGARGGSMRHFELHEARLGMHLRRGCYPFEVEKVDEGSAAHDRGVPQDSIMFRVNGRRLSPTDGEEERERVRKELREKRPLSFDVVLRCAAGLRSLVGGLPAVPGKTGVAGADAGAGVGRGTLKELICSLPDEEQETVVSVLRKLLEERPKEHQCVHAVLRELAGSD